MLAAAMMAIARRADKMPFVQIGDLRHDLHLSIFPSLVSDRRFAPIINVKDFWQHKYPLLSRIARNLSLR